MLFPKATVIMFHTLGSLKNIGSFSHSFGGRSPKSKCWQSCRGEFSVAPSEACRGEFSVAPSFLVPVAILGVGLQHFNLCFYHHMASYLCVSLLFL